MRICRWNKILMCGRRHGRPMGTPTGEKWKKKTTIFRI